MKKKFKRLISWMLIVSMLLSMVAITPVHAATYNEATEDATLDSVSSKGAGDWGTAIYVDHLAWNAFHNAVQNHIVDKYTNMGKELPITWIHRISEKYEIDNKQSWGSDISWVPPFLQSR